MESEQNEMVDSELRNIDGLEKEEGTNVPEPLFDVPSEQIIFPDSPSFWSTSLAPVFNENPQVSVGSSGGSG